MHGALAHAYSAHHAWRIGALAHAYIAHHAWRMAHWRMHTVRPTSFCHLRGGGGSALVLAQMEYSQTHPRPATNEVELDPHPATTPPSCLLYTSPSPRDAHES
eukprot:273755-Chlamydomonas_euryale.AAC.1